MIDVESAKIYFSLNKEKLLFGIPIVSLMILVGGLAGYGATTLVNLWWVWEVCIGVIVFAPVAHVTGVVGGLTMEKIIGDTE